MSDLGGLGDRQADCWDAAIRLLNAGDRMEEGFDAATMLEAVTLRDAAFHDLQLAVRGECRLCDDCEGYIG